LKYVYSIGFLEGNVKIGDIHYLTEPVLVLSSHKQSTAKTVFCYTQTRCGKMSS